MIAEALPGKGINLLTEGLSLTEASKHLRGKRGKTVCIHVVRLWITRGVPIPGSEERLRLRGSKVNGEWITTLGWIREFEGKRLKLGEYKPPERIERPERSRAASVNHARRQLERHGIKAPAQGDPEAKSRPTRGRPGIPRGADGATAN